MRKIGITGGVGAGKSTVLEILRDKYNAVIYMADSIAHLLEEPGEPCYNEMIAYFGNKILDANGKISSKELASIIFKGKEALQKVNSIVHPNVKKYILNKMAEEEAKGTEIFVFEAALLIEDGYLNILDEIWYIYASEEVRRERLIQSRGYSNEKIDSIMSNQLKDSEFMKLCKHSIDNSKSVEDTVKSIEMILGDSNG